MKQSRKYIAVVVLLIVSSVAAFAQTNTHYGYKIERNRNLRYVQAEKAHTEINVSAVFSGSKTYSYGVNIQASRVWTPAKVFSWQAGGVVSAEYAGKYGAMSDVLGLIGVRFGNTISFGVDALAGVGQMSYYAEATNGESVAKHFNTVWRPEVGGQASLTCWLTDGVSLGVFGRYAYYINTATSAMYREPEGWEAKPVQNHDQKWTVGLSLGFRLGGAHQLSGDNCWHVGAYSGYSFVGNKGILAGAEMFHTKRVGAKGMRLFGFGSEQVFGDHVSTNAVYSKAGYQILPRGAQSVVIFEFGAKAGLGEYGKTEVASTENGSYTMKSRLTSLGAVAKAYVGINFHFGRHSIKVTGEGGYHICFDSKFVSKTSNYTGTTGKLHGADAAVTVGYSIAF